MLTLAVVIIAAIMIVANFEIVIALAIWAAMLAAGLAMLAGVIYVFVTWPVQVFGTIILLIGVYFFMEWDINRESKHQAEKGEPM